MVVCTSVEVVIKNQMRFPTDFVRGSNFKERDRLINWNFFRSLLFELSPCGKKILDRSCLDFSGDHPSLGVR